MVAFVVGETLDAKMAFDYLDHDGSRARAVVEHAVAEIKRCRIVADTFLRWSKHLVDEVMLAAYGPLNLWESCRVAV